MRELRGGIKGSCDHVIELILASKQRQEACERCGVGWCLTVTLYHPSGYRRPVSGGRPCGVSTWDSIMVS